MCLFSNVRENIAWFNVSGIFSVIYKLYIGHKVKKLMYAFILNKSVIIYKYGGSPGRDCNVVSSNPYQAKCTRYNFM